MDLVSMGKILKPKGLKGELWMTVFNEINSVLDVGMSVWMTSNDGRDIDKVIESIKISSSKSLIKFKNCDSRNDVDSLIGLQFSISRSLFYSLEEGEIYLVDLIGFMVYDSHQIEIGEIKDTISFPNQNIIIVKSKDGEILIPFVDSHIAFFDKKEKKVIVNSIEGLVN